MAPGRSCCGTGSQHRVDSRQPGLAVDPDGRRAFVVGPTVVAEIDLRTLKVAYHSLERPRSLFARLHDWLEPAAAAKQVSGYHREASWLGGGLLAVSGADTVEGRVQPEGLLLVSTSAWTVRKINPESIGFDTAGDLLLTYGTARGLTAYSFDGRERFHVFEGKHCWPELVYRGSAYVVVGGQQQLQIVDLGTGRVVGVRREPLPSLLQGVAAGWWE